VREEPFSGSSVGGEVGEVEVGGGAVGG